MTLAENLIVFSEASATNAASRETFLSMELVSGWSLSFWALKSSSQDCVALAKHMAERDALKMAEDTSTSLVRVSDRSLREQFPF